jgi:hypothetical protein
MDSDLKHKTQPIIKTIKPNNTDGLRPNLSEKHPQKNVPTEKPKR